MRKGTAMIVVGGILLLPPTLVLTLTALMRSATGQTLLSRALAFFGVQDFGIYWDPKVVSVAGVLGSALVLLGLWNRRTHRGRV